jgi:hypothetical protein
MAGRSACTGDSMKPATVLKVSNLKLRTYTFYVQLDHVSSVPRVTGPTVCICGYLIFSEIQDSATPGKKFMLVLNKTYLVTNCEKSRSIGFRKMSCFRGHQTRTEVHR